MDKFLDLTGVKQIWEKIKATFLPLSGGDMTGALGVTSITHNGTNLYQTAVTNGWINVSDVESMTNEGYLYKLFDLGGGSAMYALGLSMKPIYSFVKENQDGVSSYDYDTWSDGEKRMTWEQCFLPSDLTVENEGSDAVLTLRLYSGLNPTSLGDDAETEGKEAAE